MIATVDQLSTAPVTILTLNSGSSSLKFGLYRAGSNGVERLISGDAQDLGTGKGTFEAVDGAGRSRALEDVQLSGENDVLGRVEAFLTSVCASGPDAIGHRIVHGGPALREHCFIDASTIKSIETAVAFAPLHIPAALSLVRGSQKHFPDARQIACFDTAFHASMPELASTLPLPKALKSEGIRRYGFHGLSCESILKQLQPNVPDRLIIAHLGNGASITAVKGGRSVDTSMGMTPTGGVIMGTRSGDLDPGVLIFLMREKKLYATGIEDMLDHHSGLAGISGVGGDMRTLHQAAASNPDAALAIDMFCMSVRKQIAAMAAVLDGFDTIVFTGGIGEHDAVARKQICQGFSWMGLTLDEARNRMADGAIDAPGSRVAALVLPSQEDDQIAHHVWKLFQNA